VKWNELKKIAERNGWRFRKHGKKHDEYRHPEKPYPIQIGRHGTEEIAKGTYEDLKKKIGF
jgi:predicted RNA binding protein YcfA (HicA-like mRNA interferase family)